MKFLVVLTSQHHIDHLPGLDFQGATEILLAALVPGLIITDDTMESLQLRIGAPVRFHTAESLSHNISQVEISRLATDFTLILTDTLRNSDACNKLTEETDKLDSQANMMALILHPLYSFGLFLSHLLQSENTDKVYLMGNRKFSFSLPQRPDVKTLYNADVAFCPLAREICEYHGADYRIFNVSPVFKTRLKLALRHFLLQIYKFQTIVRRLAATPANNLEEIAPGRKNLLVLIRAESEYWSIRPLLRKIETTSDFTPVVIQDDLVKNPSALKALTANNEEFIPIHSQAGLGQALSSWVSQSLNRARLKHCATKVRESGSNEGQHFISAILLKPDFTKEIIDTATCCFHELDLFQKEITAICRKLTPGAMITLDMVDQWVGIIGKIGRGNGIPSFTMQNTSLDKIIYPKPVSTDVFWVSNNNIRNILLDSRATPESVVTTGLPMHDELLLSLTHEEEDISAKRDIAADKKILLVATQPFVQKYPYNLNLLTDLCRIFKGRTDLCLLIKTHPREHKENYLSLLQKLKKEYALDIRLEGETNIIDLMCISEAMISRTSTAIMTSLLAGIPTISYMEGYQNDILDRLDYLGTDAVIKAYDLGELKEVCQTIFSQGQEKDAFMAELSKKRQNYIREYVGAPDGNASEKILANLKEHIGTETGGGQ
ncbi:CDP-glycerol glycerophosphotransferase family protein [Emcibacter sp.]|uniref:CDP-glycerol glycerophosphotransferase family protein n=1 Tax=Emcibacter sp. TaxID=1979954 RepID=UPI003A906DB9